MAAIRHYRVRETREVVVQVHPDSDLTYEQSALKIATEGFQNPGQFEEGMGEGMISMPAIVETEITRL